MKTNDKRRKRMERKKMEINISNERRTFLLDLFYQFLDIEASSNAPDTKSFVEEQGYEWMNDRSDITKQEFVSIASYYL